MNTPRGAAGDSHLVEGRCLRDDRFEVPVLMYHHVEPAPLDPPAVHTDSYVPPDEFARHLDLLARRGFTTVTLAEAARRHHVGDAQPSRTVVLTFDDGCRCFAEHALPALRERAMVATLFAVSGELGGQNRWDRPGHRGGGESAPSKVTGARTDRQGGEEGPAPAVERREDLLSAAELRQVAAAGIEVGSHGATHRDLSQPLAESALLAEVGGSKTALEGALDLPVQTFCYPYGRASGAARRAARQAGYLAAVTIHGHEGALPGDPWAVPRMIVRPGEAGFELWLKAKGLYPAWSRLPRLGILAALRGRDTASQEPR